MKLSKEQMKVVDEIKSGLYVWTNEGSNLEAWIGNAGGDKMRNLRVRTVEILANKEVIKVDESGNYPSSLYRYVLNK